MNDDNIRCNTIPYRQGFIEVRPNIHPGLLNIEVWNIQADIDMNDPEKDDLIPQDAVDGNAELELSIQEAELLINQLQIALKELTQNKS